MSMAKITNHWEGTGCDGRCEFCLYGDSKDCSAEIKKDTQALVKDYKTLKAERDQLVGIKVLLLQDIEERDQMLQKKVGEIYPEFMKDYQTMREELDELYSEVDRLEKELEKEKTVDVQLNFDGINGNSRNRRGFTAD